ncbi:hypothetical protein C2857_004607 [Epichloe festucae Fl1]|uniref:Uncharacterized protein n=1 Tax=Epichloe festucae (strain Fl1) TaxID=877507 RepID=A0A7S9KKS7_EPIFF|nr:hypothetical protein C2857_004607 [Epichloe festucae Fl1]
MYNGVIAGGPFITGTNFSPPRKNRTTTQRQQQQRQTARTPAPPVAAKREQQPEKGDTWPACTGSNPNNNTDPPLRKALKPGPASKVFIALPSGLTVNKSTVISSLDRDPRLLYKPLPKSTKGRRPDGPKSSSSNTAKPVSRSYRRPAPKKPKKSKSSALWDCFGGS